MSWSWRIGRLFGIDVRVHATFGILLGWVALSAFMEGQGHVAALSGVLLIVLVFGIVVLHELGHALMARRFGIHTRDITLLPIGGVARLEGMPQRPLHEFLVAIAGPAVNAVLALCAYFLSRITHEDLVIGSFRPDALWSELVSLNVGLMAFNLLPAFPMDGGRALRALLAMRLSSLRATRIAATIGQGMALVLGTIGMFYNPLLVLIAVFVWMGAGSESRMAKVSAALGNVPVSAVMLRRFVVLSADTPLDTAAQLALSGFQAEFPVLSEGHLVGMLSRAELLHARAQVGTHTPIGELMKRDFSTIDPGEMLDVALRRMQASMQQALPVMQDGELVGMLLTESIVELLSVARKGPQLSQRATAE